MAREITLILLFETTSVACFPTESSMGMSRNRAQVSVMQVVGPSASEMTTPTGTLSGPHSCGWGLRTLPRTDGRSRSVPGAAGSAVDYRSRRRVVTQLVAADPPTLNTTPTSGVRPAGASPMGSSTSCL